MIKKITYKNFYKSTVADWIRCELPDRKPDYVSFSGSAYWFYKNKVKRLSDHWGKVSSCKWLIEGKNSKIFVCAECYYDDFRILHECKFFENW